jgi:predicted RNA-binding Zn ribbon-like protein
MAVSKAGRKSDWKDGFLFLGNHLALDFLNMCPVQNGEAVELLPDFDALLRWFRAADLLNSREAASLRQLWGESARAQHVMEAVRELRESLRKEVPARERGGTVHRAALDELNHLMAEHPMLTRLKASGKPT